MKVNQVVYHISEIRDPKYKWVNVIGVPLTVGYQITVYADRLQKTYKSDFELTEKTAIEWAQLAIAKSEQTGF